MGLDSAGKLVLTGLATVGAALELARRFGGSGLRGRIRRDLEIWTSLPDSPAKAKLLDLIESNVAKIVENGTIKRRDPAGIALAILFIAAALTVGYFGLTNDGWWRALLLLSVLLLILGSVGLSEDARPAIRDDGGRRLDR